MDLMKSPRAMRYVKMEFVSNVSATVSVAIVSVDAMSDTRVHFMPIYA
jgi:hypothetical protein